MAEYWEQHGVKQQIRSPDLEEVAGSSSDQSRVCGPLWPFATLAPMSGFKSLRPLALPMGWAQLACKLRDTQDAWQFWLFQSESDVDQAPVEITV